MKIFGNLLTIGGLLFLAAGAILRVYPEPLKHMPLTDLTPSSFAHFGGSLFLAAIAVFAMYIASKK